VSARMRAHAVKGTGLLGGVHVWAVCGMRIQGFMHEEQAMQTDKRASVPRGDPAAQAEDSERGCAGLACPARRAYRARVRLDQGTVRIAVIHVMRDRRSEGSVVPGMHGMQFTEDFDLYRRLLVELAMERGMFRASADWRVSWSELPADPSPKATQAVRQRGE
jgi:hypothetical protein